MKEKTECLRAKLAERLEEAEQGAKWARSSTEHYYYQTRLEEINWCYQEIITILDEDPPA